MQIDLDPKMLFIRYPMEVPLCGDAADTLRAMLPLLERKTDRSWRKKIEAEIVDWEGVIEARAMNDNNPGNGINPERVFHELSPRLPANCILAADSGSSSAWYARYLKVRPGTMGSVSGTLASMGCAVPYAIAAKFAWPERVPVAPGGDGAMLMSNRLAHFQRSYVDGRHGPPTCGMPSLPFRRFARNSYLRVRMIGVSLDHCPVSFP